MEQRKVGDEGNIFNDYRRKSFFTERAGTGICLIFHRNIPVMKEYNMGRNYGKAHEGMGKIKLTF